jgi:hypothetical protein
MALLVVLGMPVGEAALAAPLLVGAATKVITDLQVTESATESGKAVSKPESVSNNPHFAKPAPDTDTNDRPAVSKPLPDQD